MKCLQCTVIFLSNQLMKEMKCFIAFAFKPCFALSIESSAGVLADGWWMLGLKC